MILRYLVPRDGGGRQVYTVLRRELNLSAALVRRLKAAQGIFVDGRCVYTNYILSPGETVAVDIALAEPPCDLVPQKGEVEILYENEGILAAGKPAGMITHPSRAQYLDSLSNYVAGYLEKTSGDYRCHSVNRLDRGTSGVILFSKNCYMMDKCSQALREESAEKLYLAVVLGEMEKPEGTIDLPIYRPDPIDMRRVVDDRGQRAVTHYKTAAVGEINGEKVSALKLKLETGRTHQIRVHCAHLGHPILGDKFYNDERSLRLSYALELDEQLLHAYRLSFREPLHGEHLEIDAPITRSDMADVISAAFGQEKLY